jgi:hypothetical protein
VGPRARLDSVEKKKISCFNWESNDSSVARPTAPYRMRYPDSLGALTEEKVVKILKTVILISILYLNEVSQNYQQKTMKTDFWNDQITQRAMVLFKILLKQDTVTFFHILTYSLFTVILPFQHYKSIHLKKC